MVESTSQEQTLTSDQVQAFHHNAAIDGQDEEQRG